MATVRTMSWCTVLVWRLRLESLQPGHGAAVSLMDRLIQGSHLTQVGSLECSLLT